MELGTKDLAGLISDLSEGILITSWLGGIPMERQVIFFGSPRSSNRRRSNWWHRERNERNRKSINPFQSLIEVGNDPWRFSPLKAPTLVFEDVNFSGA